MQQRVQHPTDEARLQTAVETLARDAPHLSASSGIWPWQAAIFAATAGLLAAGLWLAPEVALPVLMVLLTIPFFCATALRVAAIYGLARPRREKNRTAPPPLADKDLPTYTLLVPLYREAAVVPGLIAAMTALDYPAEKLEIFLIVEAIDDETIAAIGATTLPSPMTMIRVPDGSPRTKPRALNYALTYATGDLVVVYDAEDEPEQNQLRLAAAWFSAARSRGVACLQARLNIYNTADSWLTRGIAWQTHQTTLFILKSKSYGRRLRGAL